MGSKGVRSPAVSGIYYPEEPAVLRETVRRLLSMSGRVKRRKAVGIVAPHGGLRSAGPVLGAVHASVEWPAAVVIVGPNHSGQGAPFGISVAGVWSTPLGLFPVHERLARRILKSTPELERDDLCHRYEHAVEVQIPFLQCSVSARSFVPIALRPCDGETAVRIGRGIADALQKSPEPVMLVASTNLTTYRSEETAARQDPAILDPILALEPETLLEVAGPDSGMCGASAAAVVLTAAKILGAGQGHLVRYQTSAEATGVRVSVVGYAGILLEN